ncbi:MAG: M50 family metallopeptidase [bacterium]|nr:M50 family metallopeptidase [bacterium]
MFIIISILSIIVGLSLLIIIHELGHFCAAKWSGLLVEEFGIGFPPRIWAWRPKRWIKENGTLRQVQGETEYSFNWLPFGGFVRIYGERAGDERVDIPQSRSFAHQSVWRRMYIVGAGVLMNFMLGWLLISAVFAIGLPRSLVVTDVVDSGIAESAGIQKSDQLIGFESVTALTDFLNKNKGIAVPLTVKRNGGEIIITVTPRVEVPEGEGNLGILLVEMGLERQGIFGSLWEGMQTALQMVWLTILGFVDLVIGIVTDASVFDKFVGPVGIVNVAIETTRLGFVHFLQLLGIISINLAVFNLIPIPALDGGRMFFLWIEKLRGKALDPKIEMTTNGIGFALLMLLIAVITVKDILTLL